MLSPFIILTASAAVLLGEAVDIDTNYYPPKCCPFGQVLNSTLHCVIDDTELLVPTNVFYRYPNCSRNNISVISAEYNNSVMCLDKTLPSNISISKIIRDSSKLIGLTCADNISDYKNNNLSFYVPLVDSIKKCCPPDRKYTNYTNGCWDKTVKDDIRTVKKLIKALLNDTNNYVDITYGAPICKSDEVLVDYQIPYKQVRQLDSEGIVMRIPGHTETIILPPESICVDIYSYDDLTIIVRVCQDETVTCKIQKKTCIRKCCRDGESMVNNTRTCERSKDLFDPKFYKNVKSVGVKLTTQVYPSIIYGMCKNIYMLEPWKYEDDESYLDSYGELYFPILNEHFNKDHYCIEFVKSKRVKLSKLVTFSCFPDESTDEYPPESKMTSAFYIAVGTGSIISCFFLFITLIVYSCLPNLQNIHGKTVMCYIFSLLAAYVCLSVNQLGSIFFLLGTENICRAIGYATFFTFFAAFCWLHTLCFDIWYTFGSVRSSFVRRKSKSRSRRFLMYNLYCWGFSALITSSIIATDYAAKFGFISHNWVSDIGITRCWFSYKTKGMVIFFIIPIGIQLLINLIFFILTTRHCLRVRSEISKTHNSSAKMKYDNDKEKLIMTVKLFIVTGITWGLEILSQLMDPISKWWFVSDVTNVFQGVLIFLLFVLKEKIILGISQRFRELLPCYDKTETAQKTRCNSSTVFTTTSSECKLSSVRQK